MNPVIKYIIITRKQRVISSVFYPLKITFLPGQRLSALSEMEILNVKFSFASAQIMFTLESSAAQSNFHQLVPKS